MKKSMKSAVAICLGAVVGVGIVPTTASADTGGPQQSDVVSVLRTLQGHQSAAEIDALMTDDVPVEALVDPSTGTVLAVRRVPARGTALKERKVQVRALTPVGPGCTSTSACMRRSTGGPYGLTGTGTKKGTWKNVTGVSSGNRRTTFWASNGMAYEYRADTSVNWSGQVTVTKVSR